MKFCVYGDVWSTAKETQISAAYISHVNREGLYACLLPYNIAVILDDRHSTSLPTHAVGHGGLGVYRPRGVGTHRGPIGSRHADKNSVAENSFEVAV